jgi:NAD-dependent SIR2 family protein deacetylase
MMQSYPAVTWKYLAQIERACRGARSNPGHEVIAALEDQFDRVWTLTQNIDGLHRQAGSRNVIDIHGDLHDLYCTRCGFREVRAYRDRHLRHGAGRGAALLCRRGEANPNQVDGKSMVDPSQ